jgi:hypothetical protein
MPPISQQDGAMKYTDRTSPKGASASQPRVQPWEDEPHHTRALKERRILADRGRLTNSPRCSVLSERMNLIPPAPRALPWAGMHRPFGAITMGSLTEFFFPRPTPVKKRGHTIWNFAD